jgi:hypothetical protein
MPFNPDQKQNNKLLNDQPQSQLSLAAAGLPTPKTQLKVTVTVNCRKLLSGDVAAFQL